MKIVNLTPHKINIIGYGEIESSGIARCKVETYHITDINGVPVFRNEYGNVDGLPEQEDSNTIYVVSALTAQACGHRSDIYITNDPVRDDQGRVIGCRSLAKI